MRNILAMALALVITLALLLVFTVFLALVGGKDPANGGVFCAIILGPIIWLWLIAWITGADSVEV